MLPENKMNTSPESQAEEVIAVDLDATVEVDDAQADVNIAAPLPPAGIYPVRWQNADEKGLDGHMTKPKAGSATRAYVGGNIVGKVNANGHDYDETPVYKYINSLTMRGKPTSDLHHLLNCAGSPAPNKTTVRELLAHAEDVLGQNPAIYTELEWRAAYQDSEGKWQDAAKSMIKFPLVDDGNGNKVRLQQYPSPVDGEPLNAQLYVKAFYSEAEAKKKMAKASA